MRHFHTAAQSSTLLLLGAIAAFLMVGFLATVPSSGEPYRYRTNLENVTARFATPPDETPDFQKHVAPLLSRLGCNARACHGSFQGQGGFRLSLFGYDFAADHAALLDDMTGRVDLDAPDDSLIIAKPTDAENHEGGLRYEIGSWEHNLIRRWIADGAQLAELHQLESLEVIPNSLEMSDADKAIQMQVIAHWADGSEEDVTPLTRFESNNPQIADVTEGGVISTKTTPGDTHVVAYYDSAIVPVPVIHPYEGRLDYSDIESPTEIDQLVLAKLRRLNILPSEVCDDATYLRRVTLDITGTLPTPAAVKSFIDDTSPDKRSRVVDSLLETPAYAAWWTTFFCDLTGNNERQLQGVGYTPAIMTQQWYDWIFDRIQANVPYDELAAGIILGKSRADDESYTEYCQRMTSSFQRSRDQTVIGADDSMPYYWMRREFQDADARAISFAHSFMGVRIQCAQCHKHPFDQWTQDDFQEFSRFFSGTSVARVRNVDRKEIPELRKILQNLGVQPGGQLKGGKLLRELTKHLLKGETVPFPELKTHAAKPIKKQGEKLSRADRMRRYRNGKLLGSDPIDLTQYDDVRQPVMDWLRSADNPYFARALVNRVWARYFGIGIVEPADDLNLANPPSNAPLLEFLAQSFIERGYDLKQLHRQIAQSATYQRSWQPNESNADDHRNFSHAQPRRLPAEVIYDAVAQAAANNKDNAKYLTNIANRAIAIPGTQSRRNKYRQKARMMNGQPDPTFALSVFGKSERKASCDCERSADPTLIQTVYLKNDRDMHQLLRRKDGWIGQVNKQLAVKPLSKNEASKLAIFERRYQMLELAYFRAVATGDEDTAKSHEDRLDFLDERMAPYRSRRDARIQQSTINIDSESIVNDAYLRTLSRYPNQQELDRCVKHLESDDELFDRTGDLLWALVNTKEFIVNH